jgi:hypothetical protein
MLRQGLEGSVRAKIGQTFVVEWNASRVGAAGQDFWVSGGRALEAATLRNARHGHVDCAAIHRQRRVGDANVTLRIAERLTEVRAVRVALALDRVGIQKDTARLKQK